jgi:hypothetical protein
MVISVLEVYVFGSLGLNYCFIIPDFSCDFIHI